MDPGDAPATGGDGSCCCDTDDSAGRGADEDSGDALVNDNDGWHHTSKPCGAFWAGGLTTPPSPTIMARESRLLCYPWSTPL